MSIDLNQFPTLVRNVFANNAVQFQNNFTALLMGEIATDTPKDKGKAKGNWDAGLTPDVVPTDVVDLTITGIRARRKALSQLDQGPVVSDIANPEGPILENFKGMNRTTFIKNGVEGDDGNGYIIGLEEGASNQAPIGMVLINIVSSERLTKKAMKL